MASPVRRQYQIFIDRPPQAVFEFHANPRNLVRISPPEAKEKITLWPGWSGKSGDEFPEEGLQLGATWGFTTCRGNWGVVEMVATMEVIVTEWNPPHNWAERQAKGQFASWTHRRRFAPFEAGTLFSEMLEYEPVAGPLGSLADKIFIGKQLDALFTHRHKEAKRLLEQVGRIKGRERRDAEGKP